MKRIVRFLKFVWEANSPAEKRKKGEGVAPELGLRSGWRGFMRAGCEISSERIPIIHPGSGVFCIGSCFALEVKGALKRMGCRVYPMDEELQTTAWPSDPLGLVGRSLVHYSTFTILQEFEKAFGLWTQEESDMWRVERTLADGSASSYFQDPYRRKIFSRTQAGAHKLVRVYDEIIRSGIMASDIYIITLGMTEVWKKKDNGRWACCAPGYSGDGGQDRTVFVRSGFQENYENLRKLADLILSRFPSKKIILSVSPVPFHQTFSGNDVYVANAESKSILRAAAGQICREIGNLYYFPAFEICDALARYAKEQVYAPDGAHVTREVVERVVRRFLEIYRVSFL